MSFLLYIIANPEQKVLHFHLLIFFKEKSNQQEIEVKSGITYR